MTERMIQARGVELCTEPFGDPADQSNEGQFGNIRPASEDPYGDPADQR